MKCERRKRTLRLTGLPPLVDGHKVPTELEIFVTYFGNINIQKEITLDNFVIPLIVLALNQEEPLGTTE